VPLLRNLCFGLLTVAHPANGQVPAGESPLPRSSLCVTEGSVGELPDRRLSVTVPAMRAYVNRPTTDTAELRFTYRGATDERSPPAAGGIQEQFGLELRAANACNLIDVMWRRKPESTLIVALQSSPESKRGAQCGNDGSRTITPRFSVVLPSLLPGEAHRLRAELDQRRLRAIVDGQRVWEGSLDAAAAALSGPVGLRTDNMHLEFELFAKSPPGALPQFMLRCEAGSEPLHRKFERR
jgi:hypothetical protein